MNRIFLTISQLGARPDEAATRELFTHFESADPSVKLEVARVLLDRPLPDDLRERVASLLFDEHFGGEADFVNWSLQCAAKALLTQPAARAFQEAEPLLRGHALETPMGQRRAGFVLSALEDRLAEASALTGPERERAMPDPRFRALCEPLRRSQVEKLRSTATDVVNLFRYFQGEDVRPPVCVVSLGESDTPPFPFLIAGFPLGDSAGGAAVNAALEASGHVHSEGLGLFLHQYGGLACLQAKFLGYGVLAPDTPRTSAALQELVRTWSFTRGDEFTEAERCEWAQRLSDLLPPPGVELGAEALLLGFPGVPLRTLRGAEVLGFGTTREPWRGFVDMSQPDPDMVRCGRYDEVHEQVLTSVGQALGLGMPRIIVLWGNSD